VERELSANGGTRRVAASQSVDCVLLTREVVLGVVDTRGPENALKFPVHYFTSYIRGFSTTTFYGF
jgi:hypothetical protein